jgi:hypothetical protein
VPSPASAIDELQPGRDHIDRRRFVQKSHTFGNALASEEVVGVENRNIIASSSVLDPAVERNVRARVGLCVQFNPRLCERAYDFD